MPETLPTRYDFTKSEDRIYKMWKANSCFSAARDLNGKSVHPARADAKPYVIAIPPPNVTGRLHMGHALNNSFQDIIIRYKRMDGYDALWIPGTDHAGIATQTVVKKLLDAQGVDYRVLGRDKFTAKVWEWKEKYGGMILDQLARIGCSCDWERTRFTMDAGLSRAVKHCFKRLYDDGLIYRGERIVNWCPVDRTALSDDEVETRDGGEPGFLWQIKYKLADGSGHLIVATTRPETLFGDVAVAVNPQDERYKNLIGKKVIVPLMERVVPIIADAYVDMSFGTGCLKITPAHDPNDFEIGARHNLLPINVMHEDATMNDIVPEPYRGLKRDACRKKALQELREHELLVSEEPRRTPLGRSYRSKAVIEYRLSRQWFVKMRPLAEKVLQLHSQLNIIPRRWNKVYLDWLDNIRDWCISRQIWWGHRVPVWYCDGKECADVVIVAETPPPKCPRCSCTEELLQDPDVLDTWFSSALWPMSTLGWPDTQAPDFQRYFPTSTLVTAKDIIFFWVARMNMMSAHFTGKMPYQNVFITPTVLDDKGETMSKSKGNGIDPLTVVNGATLEEMKAPVMEARPANMQDIIRRLEKNYPQGYEGVGADALRWTLVYLSSGGQQLKISLDAFQDLGRRFLTKLWNAARFIMMYVEQEPSKGGGDAKPANPTLEDLWIRVRLIQTATRVRACLDGFDFTNLGEILYRLVWNDFCDWYVELCKVRLVADDAGARKTALVNLVAVFAETLKLLHPVIPFVTEDLWGKIMPVARAQGLWDGKSGTNGFLMLSQYPHGRDLSPDETAVTIFFGRVQDIVGRLRMLRKTYGIKDSARLKAWILPLDETSRNAADGANATIVRLAGLDGLASLTRREEKPKGTITVIEKSFEAYLDVAGQIDVAKEKERLNKEIARLNQEVDGVKRKLANENFIANAKAEIVSTERAKLVSAEEQLAKNRAVLGELGEL